MTSDRYEAAPVAEPGRSRLVCLAAGLFAEMTAYASWCGGERTSAVVLTLAAAYLLSVGLWMTLVLD